MKIVFVGLSGVPRCMRACDVRLTSFANLLSRNHDVIILNRFSNQGTKKAQDLSISNNVQIKEIIPSCNVSKFLVPFFFALSVLIEPIELFLSHRKKKIDIIHIYSNHYIDFLLYKVFALVIGAKVVYQYVEFRSSFKKRNLYHSLNAKLCDKYGPYLWDGVIPISDYLEKHTLSINRISSCKVSPLCDFSQFDKSYEIRPVVEPYILYCGKVGYETAIQKILDAYRDSKLFKRIKLVLVLSGNQSIIDKYISEASYYTVCTKLPYDTLISYYSNATCLLIPLDNTIKDIARSPNKLCEYVASHGAIITTNIGEAGLYFEDGVNAIVAENDTTEALKLCFDRLAEGEYDIDKIKEKSYLTGKSIFDINAYEDKLNRFLEEVLNA